MKTLMASLFCGFVFGLGLAVSQMVNPAKVLAFLDIFGDWDPSLALVMGGALAVTLIFFRRISSTSAPLLDTHFRLPSKTRIDRRLLGGATIFGLGWGMIGYCPGPALASIASGATAPLIVVGSMILGFWLHRRVFGE